jgi:hypothetical protein
MSDQWYCVGKVVAYTYKYSVTYKVKIQFSTQNFIDAYKHYMQNCLFSNSYRVIRTGIHPESVPPQTLYNCPSLMYVLRDEKILCNKTLINLLDNEIQDMINKIERKISAYMTKFINHIYSTYDNKSCCYCTCFDDEYFTKDKYRHMYDLDSNTITTLKRVPDPSGHNDKMVPYTFLVK